MVEIISGNILEAHEEFICHQVNCQNAMGAGLAKVLCSKYPSVKRDYHRYCDSHTPEELLGQYQIVPVTPSQSVVNIFGQLEFGRKKGKVYTDYNALEQVFSALHEAFPDASFAFPYGFGCGLANGDWHTVLGLIQKHLDTHTVRIYVLETA